MRRVGTDARPESESATAGVVWRGRARRSGVFASCPLGAGGARPRVDGAPRPPGSVRAGRTPGASAKQDPCAGGPRVRVPCSRVLIACTGGTPGCGVRSDRARGSGTQAHPVEGRGRARGPPRAPSGSCASSGLMDHLSDCGVTPFRREELTLSDPKGWVAGVQHRPPQGHHLLSLGNSKHVTMSRPQWP